MALIFRNITREIATDMASGLINNNRFGKSDKQTDLWQMLLSEISKEVMKQLKEGCKENILKNINIQFNGKDPKEGLYKAEEKLDKIFNRTIDDEEQKGKEKRELDDLDDADLETIEKLEKKGLKMIYPNLKYRKPKYQNVNELLKYVESDKDNGEGIKLVIMNFND